MSVLDNQRDKYSSHLKIILNNSFLTLLTIIFMNYIFYNNTITPVFGFNGLGTQSVLKSVSAICKIY